MHLSSAQDMGRPDTKTRECQSTLPEAALAFDLSSIASIGLALWVSSQRQCTLVSPRSWTCRLKIAQSPLNAIKVLTEVCHSEHFWASHGRCATPGLPMRQLVGLSC